MSIFKPGTWTYKTYHMILLKLKYLSVDIANFIKYFGRMRCKNTSFSLNRQNACVHWTFRQDVIDTQSHTSFSHDR